MSFNFENKYIKRMDVHYSRIIESWHNAWTDSKKTRPRNDYKLFREWLGSLVIFGEKLTDEEIFELGYIYQNGKMECEESAKKFISNL